MKQPLTVRERTKELEQKSLAAWATLATETKGRDRHEDPDPLRTAFQQDRDRILHSRAFRRLAGKTHAHLAAAPGLDAYRSRVTHTLEVCQIARTIARALRLNEDLTEAIALGHDLGHTAFGRAGEAALAIFSDPPFAHAEQSLRVVERLEQRGLGLNLTWEVRDGILHHTWSMPPAATLEGQVVRLANRVAVLTHDLDDALRVGLLHPDDLPESATAVLGHSHGERVSAFVTDIVTASADRPEVVMGPEVHQAQAALATVVAERVHESPAAQAQADRAAHCLRSLAVYYLEHAGALPPAFQGDEPAEPRVLDYVSSLTDRAALRAFSTVFVPDVDAAP